MAWVGLDKPVAARSAAQSCAAQVAADELAVLARVVELELERSATEPVLPAVQDLPAEPRVCA